MKEAYATFPPIQFGISTDGSGSATYIKNTLGYDASELTTGKLTAAKVVEIDLRGLTAQDKSLLIKNLHVARLPSFDDTVGKTSSSTHCIYQITDMHLVTTSPICYDLGTDGITAFGGSNLAAAQNQSYQLSKIVEDLGSLSDNNGYSILTPGIQTVRIDNTGTTLSEMLNLDPNMVVMCQTEVLTSNTDPIPSNAVLLNPVYSSVYGMADIAALESLWCYRIVFGTTRTANSTIVAGKLGASIIQMRTEAVKLPTLERFQVMDANFNTTNDKLG